MTETKDPIESEVETMVTLKPQFPIIESTEQAEQVAKYLNQVRGLQKRIEEWFSPMRDNAHKAWKSICGKENEMQAKPTEMIKHCRAMLANWTDREEERERQEQKRLDDEAKAKAIAEAKAEGDKQLAKDIKADKVAVMSEVVARPVEKVAGVSTRKTWNIQVVSVMDLVKAVAAGKAPIEYLLPNTSALTNVARATKGQIVIPGVRMIEVTTIAGRG